MWTVVVLPAPFGPSSANTPAGATSRSSASSTSLSPKDLDEPFELDGGGHEVTEVSERWTLIEA